jgi:hypothetical protein
LLRRVAFWDIRIPCIIIDQPECVIDVVNVIAAQLALPVQDDPGPELKPEGVAIHNDGDRALSKKLRVPDIDKISGS